MGGVERAGAGAAMVREASGAAAAPSFGAGDVAARGAALLVSAFGVPTPAALLASAPAAAGLATGGKAGAPGAVGFASGTGAAGCCVEVASAAAGGAGADVDASLLAPAGWLDVPAAGDCVAALLAVSGKSIR